MKEDAEKQASEPVRDTYRIAYILHFFLGAGNLLPWNTFITAIDYFSYLYPAKHVERVFSVAYMSSSVLMLLLLIVSSSRKPSFRLRMNAGFSMFILSLMVTPVVAWANWWAKGPHGSFALAVASVLTCGLAEGLIGGSLIGSAGKLPKEYMQAIFAGTAVSGVFVSILRIITKASLPENPRGLQMSACFYFIIGAIMLLVCMLSSNLLFVLPVMQQHYNLLDHHDEPSTDTPRPKIQDTAKQIVWPALGIFSIYVVTLSIFPGFIADDNQTSKALRDWYPILLIMAYNCSDLAGKSLTALSIPSDVGKVTWACFARVLFYPAFRLCLHGPRWLKTEVPMILLTSMLGLSNGYLTSALMILTPKSVNMLEAETAAVTMALSLGLGLFGGSILGWLWII